MDAFWLLAATNWPSEPHKKKHEWNEWSAVGVETSQSDTRQSSNTRNIKVLPTHRFGGWNSCSKHLQHIYVRLVRFRLLFFFCISFTFPLHHESIIDKSVSDSAKHFSRCYRLILFPFWIDGGFFFIMWRQPLCAFLHWIIGVVVAYLEGMKKSVMAAHNKHAISGSTLCGDFYLPKCDLKCRIKAKVILNVLVMNFVNLGVLVVL